MHAAMCVALLLGGAPRGQLYLAVGIGIMNFVRHLHPPLRKSVWSGIITAITCLVYAGRTGGAFSYILWVLPSIPSGWYVAQNEVRSIHLVIYCAVTEFLIYTLPWMGIGNHPIGDAERSRTATDITVHALATSIVLHHLYCIISRSYKSKEAAHRRMAATFEWYQIVTLPVRDLVYSLLRRQSLSKAAASRLVDPLDLLLDSMRERTERNKRDAFLPEEVRYRVLRVILVIMVSMTIAATIRWNYSVIDILIALGQTLLAIASFKTTRHLGLVVFCFQALGTTLCLRDAVLRSGGFYSPSMNCTHWLPFAFFMLASRSDSMAMMAVGLFNIAAQIAVLSADALGLITVTVPHADVTISLFVFSLCRIVNTFIMYALVAILRGRVYQCLVLQHRTLEDVTAHASNTIDFLMEGLQRDEHELHDVASVRALQILHDSLAAGLRPSSSRLTRFVAMRNADMYVPHINLSDVGMSFMLRELCMTLACALGPRILLGLPLRGTRSRRCLAWCRADRVTIARLLLDGVLSIVAQGGSTFPAEIRVRCALRGVGDQLNDPVDWTEGAHSSDDDSDDPLFVQPPPGDRAGDERRVGAAAAWADLKEAELQLHIVAIGELPTDPEASMVHGSSIDSLHAVARTFGGRIDIDHRRCVIRFPVQRPESSFERVRTLRPPGSSSASRLAAAAVSTPAHRAAAGTILVAVGDSAIRALINKQLTAMGYPVTNARSAVAARNLFQSEYRTLRGVLMDAHMTEKSLWNPTAISAFLQRRGASRVGIIWLGDRSSRIDTSDAHAIVRKPVSWPALAATLDALPSVQEGTGTGRRGSLAGSSSASASSPPSSPRR
jgi:CheY-like chemotaxis protein